MENSTEEQNQEKQKERFIRWQTKLIEQSTYINNLVLTIGIATLGFMFSILSKKELNLNCCQKLEIKFVINIIVISITFGLIGTISRLIDFRITLRKIKKEIDGNSLLEIDKLKALYKLFGTVTWWALYLQSGFFLLGIILLASVLSKIY